jgi:hypothetical protein
MHYNGVSWKRVQVPATRALLRDVALHDGRPIAVGETRTGNFLSKPYVLEYRAPGFVKSTKPAGVDGVLEAVAASDGRLWTAGQAPAHL